MLCVAAYISGEQETRRITGTSHTPLRVAGRHSLHTRRAELRVRAAQAVHVTDKGAMFALMPRFVFVRSCSRKNPKLKRSLQEIAI
jgi:hypothetical protein